MTRSQELHVALRELAERGHHRSASSVFAAATAAAASGSIAAAPRPPSSGRTGHHGRRGARAVVAVAAALALVALGVGLWSRSDRSSVETGDGPDAVVEHLVVPGDDPVRQVTAAFGRLWVVTLDTTTNTTTVRAYDPGTGRTIGVVRAPGPMGDASTLVATDHSLWIRTTTEATGIELPGGADNALYEVDPSTLTATPRRYFHGDGQVAAHGERVAADDFDHLEVVAEGGRPVWSRTTEEVVGQTPGTVPGTNGLGWLHLGGDALLVVHDGRDLVVRLDPATGTVQGRADLAHPAAPGADDPVWWFRVADGRLEGAVAEGRGVRTVARPLTGPRNLVDRIDDRRLVVASPYSILDVRTGAKHGIGDGDTDLVSVVHLAGRPWLARWPVPADGRTTIRFAPVP